ncbi:hypothetical protein CFOL_v3_28989 [Cephalotus follicularis]|uniref:B3 domain-containing protein n=1 Tax=Cephalotus follicularis TaxID=3775 RepID=A0A1Q3CZR3_CEPFO|nr:hypothetical protein CFOL_v3_28989 [Cephalotus follicularis]
MSEASSPAELEKPLVASVNERQVFPSMVSTELTLCDKSWWYPKNSDSTPRNKKPLTKLALRKNLDISKRLARKIAALKTYTPEQQIEENQFGVSTVLKLYENPFTITKKLTDSDLGHLCRLLLKTKSVKDHVLPFLSIDIVNQIESNSGATVTVWDQDTRSDHKLVLKKWSTCRSYVLIDKWRQDFVLRRGLEEGDEIGLYWDIYYSRFVFSVFNRVRGN